MTKKQKNMWMMGIGGVVVVGGLLVAAYYWMMPAKQG